MLGKARSKYKECETIIDSFFISMSCLRFKGVKDRASFPHNGIIDSSYLNHLFNQNDSFLKMEHFSNVLLGLLLSKLYIYLVTKRICT